MAQVILITSGKGGVGKSTVCVQLGRALAGAGQRVLLVEGSRRAMDVLFGVADDVVFDLADAAAGRCGLEDAILNVGCKGLLRLICAPVGAQPALDAPLYQQLVELLDVHFDVILIEADGTVAESLEPFMKACDRAVILSSADQVSARAGRLVSDYLYEQGIVDIRLCINMLPPDFAKQRPVPHLDWMIDRICAQLIAVVPFDATLFWSGEPVKPSDLSNLAKMVFDNFAQRILGNYIDLLV
ncbi:MAG: septum site-determining protein MinD [Anaerotruncus sp.]|nr:septum site-determining protein MinD [Anaerotruncus sp.]